MNETGQFWGFFIFVVCLSFIFAMAFASLVLAWIISRVDGHSRRVR